MWLIINRKTTSPEINVAYKFFQMYPCFAGSKMNAFKENVLNLKTSVNQEFLIDEIKKLHFTQNPYLCTITEDGLMLYCDVR